MVIVAHSSGKKRSIACTKKQSQADATYVEGFQFGYSITIVIHVHVSMFLYNSDTILESG